LYPSNAIQGGGTAVSPPGRCSRNRVLWKLGSICSEIQKVVVNLHCFNVGHSPENPYTFTTRLVQVSGGISGGAEGDAGGEQFAVFVRGESDSGEAFLHTLDP
jgi:hypothetical protein